MRSIQQRENRGGVGSGAGWVLVGVSGLNVPEVDGCVQQAPCGAQRSSLKCPSSRAEKRTPSLGKKGASAKRGLTASERDRHSPETDERSPHRSQPPASEHRETDSKEGQFSGFLNNGILKSFLL